jgi:hypothetical protein
MIRIQNYSVAPRVIGTLAIAGVLFASAASAQQTSSIGGSVIDTSSAVLPGVTVEAASPALIEKVRTVVSDSDGRYNIIDLRPGTYTVTFTLPGFRAFRREGIVLTAGFAATVDAELQLGSLEETITVTGETPLVDTQSARRQTVISDELLDVLPTSTKNWSTLATLTPGMSSGRMPDVAGQLDQTVGRSFHGRTGTRVEIDGMGVMNWQGNGGNEGYIIHSAGVEEMVVQTSGASAESKAAGALVNLIPREGSNAMRGSLFGLWTGEALGGSNLTDELRARGLTTDSRILEIYDATARSAARSAATGSGSTPRIASGGTVTRWPASSGTPRRAVQSGRPTRTGRRTATSGTNRISAVSPGRRRQRTS